MIPTFHVVVKRPHHTYTHREVGDILEYVTQRDLPRGALAQISRDTGIPHPNCRPECTRMWRGSSEVIDYAASVDILERCWSSIPTDNVKKAWNVV